MIPKECKRLAEVDFPIAVVSRHAARKRSRYVTAIRLPFTFGGLGVRLPLAAPCSLHSCCPIHAMPTVLRPLRKRRGNLLGASKQCRRMKERISVIAS